MQNWHLVLPPSRPSATQLERIRSTISEVPRDHPVAVLGSTPEFRDLLHECGFLAIHVLERNTGFYEEMSRARIFQNPETLVVGDWTASLRASAQTFAIIVSDLTSGNVPYEQRAEFYDGVTTALKPGGIFCDKVLTHGKTLLSVDNLVAKYGALPMNLLSINNFSSEMLFCSELLRIDERVDSSVFYELLERRVKNPRVLAFIKNAKLITPPNCQWWYGREWASLSQDYCPSLTVVGLHNDEPTSPYFGFVRMFELKKGG